MREVHAERVSFTLVAPWIKCPLQRGEALSASRAYVEANVTAVICAAAASRLHVHFH
jgi:hypothetical protein